MANPYVTSYDPQRTGPNAGFGQQNQYENPHIESTKALQATVPDAPKWEPKPITEMQDFSNMQGLIEKYSPRQLPDYYDKYIPGTKNLSKLAVARNNAIDDAGNTLFDIAGRNFNTMYGNVRETDNMHRQSADTYRQIMGNMAGMGITAGSYGLQQESAANMRRQELEQEREKDKNAFMYERGKDTNTMLQAAGAAPRTLPTWQDMMGQGTMPQGPGGASTQPTPMPPATSTGVDTTVSAPPTAEALTQAATGGAGSTGMVWDGVDPAVKAAMEKAITEKREERMAARGGQAYADANTPMSESEKQLRQSANYAAALSDIQDNMQYDRTFWGTVPEQKPDFTGVDLGELMNNAERAQSRTWLGRKLLNRFGPDGMDNAGDSAMRLNIGDGRYYLDPSKLTPETQNILKQYGLLPTGEDQVQTQVQAAWQRNAALERQQAEIARQFDLMPTDRYFDQQGNFRFPSRPTPPEAYRSRIILD